MFLLIFTYFYTPRPKKIGTNTSSSTLVVSFILGRQVLGRAVHWIEEISRFKRTLHVNWQLLLQYNTPSPSGQNVIDLRPLSRLCFALSVCITRAICVLQYLALSLSRDWQKTLANDKQRRREPFEYFYENFVFHTIANLQERAKFACEQLRLYDHVNTPIAKLWDLT